MPANAADDHIQGHHVFATLRHHQMGILLAGLHILLVHGLDGLLVLLQHALQRPAPLGHVPADPAAQPDVRIGVHKDPHIHQFPQFPVLKNQNALYNDDLPGLNVNGLLTAVVDGEVIHRALDGVAVTELV